MVRRHFFDKLRIVFAITLKHDKISHDVAVLSLKLPANERLQFLAGQYIDIVMKDGKRRSFSLANAPHDDAFLQLQDKNNDGNDYEIGYNSDQGPTADNPELGGSGQHNHTIRWFDVPLVFDPADGTGNVIANGWFAEFRADVIAVARKGEAPLRQIAKDAGNLTAIHLHRARQLALRQAARFI